MQYALIDKNTNTVHSLHGENGVQVGFKRLVSPTVAGWEDDDWKIVPLVIVKPPFDQTTHKRTGPVETIYNDRVERVWTVSAKTEQELDEDLERVRDKHLTQLGFTDDVLRAVLIVLLNEVNTLRAQLGLPQRTRQQALTAIRNTIDRN